MTPRRSKSRNAPAESIGQRLARLRQRRGFTQSELAEALDLYQSHVSAYERDRVRLNSDVIVRLVGLLGVSADEILGLKGPPPDRPLNRSLLRHIHLLEELPVRDRELILAMIRGRALERGIPADGETGPRSLTPAGEPAGRSPRPTPQGR